MKLKKVLKQVKRRAHNALAMARDAMKDDEIAAELELTPEEFQEALKRLPDFAREYRIAQLQGKSRDLSHLRSVIMNQMEPPPQLVKLYYAARHGVTDRVDQTTDTVTGEQLAGLFQEIAEKLPK